jgi:hypothetical protein
MKVGDMKAMTTMIGAFLEDKKYSWKISVSNLCYSEPVCSTRTVHGLQWCDDVMIGGMTKDYKASTCMHSKHVTNHSLLLREKRCIVCSYDSNYALHCLCLQQKATV